MKYWQVFSTVSSQPYIVTNYAVTTQEEMTPAWILFQLQVSCAYECKMWSAAVRWIILII